MTRPAGARNADFDAKRAALTRQAAAALLACGAGASLAQLGQYIGASVSNLKHYFGDRDGLFAAAAAELRRQGQPFMDDAAVPRGRDARQALVRFLDGLVAGWRQFAVGRVHAVTLAEGLGGQARGRCYVSDILEPTLATAERLLLALVAARRLPPLEPRGAALALVGPVVLALLHQDALDGAACRPLDVPTFCRRQVDAWLDGHARKIRRARRP